jgi:hypothetical protein
MSLDRTSSAMTVLAVDRWWFLLAAGLGAGVVALLMKRRADGATALVDAPALPEPAVEPDAGGGYAGAAPPAPDGSAPVGYAVKANEASMLFHTAESPFYARVRADLWFDSEEHARAAGFSRWDER